MAPATFLSCGTVSPGTVRPFCPTSSATKIWQRKRLISSGSALTRPPPHTKMEKVSSSISVRPLDSVLAGRRRPGLRPETRSCTSRRVLTGAAQGSVKVEEPSPAPVEISETLEEESAESDAAAVAPVAAKTERFKPRIPGQKARREDPTVPAEALVEGAVFTGKVTTIQSFGAFVNFGAFTDGLVHISKLSTGYVSNVSDVVSVGQEVKVTIISVEQTSGRIALSMVDKEEKEAKELAAKAGEAREGSERSRFQQGPDGRPVNRGRIAGRQNKRDEPQKPPTKLSKGQEVEGTVKNKIRSGVFVELPEEEEGFLRYSDIPGGENMAPEASLQVGEKVKATVVRIDRGKIVLTMKPIVDVSRVNRDINEGKNSAATNPFEIAFRAFNLIPPEKPTAVEEDSAGEEIVAAIDVAEAVPGIAVTEESAAVGPEVEMISPLVEAAPPADEEVSSESEVAEVEMISPLVEAAPPADEEVSSESEVAEVEMISPLVEAAPPADEEVSSESEVAAAAIVEALAAAGDVIAETPSIPTVDEAVVENLVEKVLEEISPLAEEEVSSESIPAVAAAEDAEALVAVEAATPETASAPIDDEALRMRILLGISPPADEVFAEAPASVKDIITEATSTVAGEEITAVNDDPASIEEVISDTGSAVDELSAESVPDTSTTVEDGPLEEEVVPEATASAEDIITGATPTVIEEEVIPETASAVEEYSAESVPDTSSAVEEVPLTEDPAAVVEKAPVGISAALVKQLRDETGAGMMDCKRALAEAQGDLDKAREALRKKGLASADKKASRIASEGLIGSYIHDSRIGVLVEVNCETDFVARGPVFKSLVEDVALQVVAGQQVQFVAVEDIPSEVVTKEKEMEAQREDLISKPEAIRAKIVDGRVSKRLSEFALLDQPYIRDDKISVKDLVKQTVVTLGENIKVRRFERYILGEGLQKKGTDFAAEVAAQTAVKAPVEPPVTKEAPVEEPGTDEKVVVSAALVKELRGQTGAGMMDCKKALASCANDLEKAVEFLRKKGLASAEKKASRIASDGLIGTYIHDGRIGILIEVNCETDFVARGEKFKELVEDLAMQVAAYPQVQVVSVDDIPADVVAKEKELESGKEDLASKPEAILARIVDGRVAKRLSELALLEQPFIKDDKKLVKDVVKETVAALGENILVRRFTRFNLGEGIEKKVVDFASEVAAQSSRKS